MMKSNILSKSRKNLSDYQILIENGYVLDVRGQWIPLNEKVKKERNFVAHLEAGEVLKSGKWMNISEAVKLRNYKIDPVTLPPQDQISSEDRIVEPQAYAGQIEFTDVDVEMPVEMAPESQDTDFPPETIMISTEDLSHKISSAHLNNLHHNLPQHLPLDPVDSEERDFCMETIAIPLSSISHITPLVMQPSEDNSMLESWERSRNKHKKTVMIVIAVSILSLLAVAGFLFSGQF